MKKIYISLFTLSFLLFASKSNGQFDKLLSKAKTVVNNGSSLSQGEIGEGLKAALEVGVDDAVSTLSAKDGYLGSIYKIEVPKEAKKVTSKLKKLPGFKNIERDLVLKMNEAAEIAAKKATPIFIDAIKQITFNDAKNILAGDDNAATVYLKDKSYKTLYSEFLPVIQAALDEVKAREYWTSASRAYNKIPFTKKVNTELDDHVNKTALTGLFSLIAKKEEGIRTDYNLRSSDLLKKVFGSK